MLETEETKEMTNNQPSGEDMLLAQIDAFRDKAKQLQGLINAKEQKVKDLEAMVQEKELRNAQLQNELAEKQAEADSIAADVETQVDRMMQTLRGNMDNLEKRIEEQVADNQENAATQTKEMRDTLQEMTSGLDAIKGELSEKVHSENVKQYRNIQDLLKELDNSEEENQNTMAKFAMLKKRTTGLTVFAIINIVLSGVTMLIMLLVIMGL
ncbi:MAG: hypothetical protein SO172_04340 [Pararoseburia sp.]|nr:hypothetical protein [Lachnospiraceae bacterium]MDY4793380.1 hypothetical protein [Pararoseburia sp.]